MANLAVAIPSWIDSQPDRDRQLSLEIVRLEERSRITQGGQERRRLEVLVPPNVVDAAREQSRFAENVQNLIVETAHDLYAMGSGDELGDCEARANLDGSITLVYDWHNRHQDVDTFYAHYNTITSSSTISDARFYEAVSDTRFNEAVSWSSGLSIAYNPICPEALRDAPLPPRLTPEKAEIVNRKAEALLLQHLNERQRKTWLAEKYFDVKVPSGRIYRLIPAMFHNVFLVDNNGKRLREYCAYSKDPKDPYLPVYDNLVAQMLTLMFDEQHFLAMANTWDLLGSRTFIGQGADASSEALELAA